MNLLPRHSQFKKHHFPNFGELNFQFDVAQLILDYHKICNSLSDRRYDKLIPSRSYIADHFPIKDSGYLYYPITKFKEDPFGSPKKIDFKSISKESGLAQFRRGFKTDGSAYVAELDERRYTNIPDNLPPYLSYALSLFKGQVGRTRFALLKAKQQIKEHVDNNLDHTVRIHIPLVTNKDCAFGVKRASVWETKHLPADGKAYFVNTAFPHKVENNSAQDRLHLIVNLNTQHDVYHICKRHTSTRSD